MGTEYSVWLFTKTPVPEKVREASAEKAKQFIKHAGSTSSCDKTETETSFITMCTRTKEWRTQ